MPCGTIPARQAPGMRNLRQKLLLAGLIASAVSATACTSGAVTYRAPRGYATVYTAPPDPYDYYYVDRPGYVYIQGRWIWDGGDWRWIDGRYVRARPGYVYHQGYWGYDGGRYVWRPGGWQRHRDGYVYRRGYYDYRDGRYVYRPGRWMPQRQGHVWIEGRWISRDGRRVYRPGRWEQRDRVRDHRDRRIYTSPRRRR